MRYIKMDDAPSISRVFCTRKIKIAHFAEQIFSIIFIGDIYDGWVVKSESYTLLVCPLLLLLPALHIHCSLHAFIFQSCCPIKYAARNIFSLDFYDSVSISVSLSLRCGRSLSHQHRMHCARSVIVFCVAIKIK